MKSFHIINLVIMVVLSLAIGCDKKETDSMLDNKYLIRCAQFDMIKQQLVVTDPNSPRVITMDPWHQIVFLAADGQVTVSKLISELSNGYKDGPPPDLQNTVQSVVEELVSEGIINLSKSPTDLPYYLSLPVSQQDLEKARQLMIDDGFIKNHESESDAQ
jgi:Coenzyme PQQ synthesis protein D (PqqD)